MNIEERIEFAKATVSVVERILNVHDCPKEFKDAWSKVANGEDLSPQESKLVAALIKKAEGFLKEEGK